MAHLILDADSLLYKAVTPLTASKWKVTAVGGVWFYNQEKDADDCMIALTKVDFSPKKSRAKDEEVFTAICERYDYLVNSTFSGVEWMLQESLSGKTIVLSAAKHIYWRSELYPEYKQTRAKRPPLAFLDRLRSYAHTQEDVVVAPTAIEADDVVVMLAHRLGGDSVVAGIDKDLLQIPGKHYNYNKQILIDVSPFEATRNLFMQCIEGDSADNIKGVKGYGKVKARKILKDCRTCFNLYSATKNIYKQVYGDKWQTQFKLNYQLLRLHRRNHEIKRYL